MVADNTRRQNKTVSATKTSSKPPASRGENVVVAGVVRWLKYLATELLGAVQDHRKWINSDRARALETIFVISGRLLIYSAYIALAYLAVNSFVGIHNGLAGGIYAIPEHVDGLRVALFYILAAGLVGPVVIIAVGIGIGWAHNLTTAAANRALPRFAQPLIYPSILFVVVAGFATYHSAVTATLASGYLYTKSTIEAASPKGAVAIKIIETPRVDVSGDNGVMENNSSSERELVRLRSIFNSGQPCPVEGQRAEAVSPPELTRPEPGLAPRHDCQVGKAVTHK